MNVLGIIFSMMGLMMKVQYESILAMICCACAIIAIGKRVQPKTCVIVFSYQNWYPFEFWNLMLWYQIQGNSIALACIDNGSHYKEHEA